MNELNRFLRVWRDDNGQAMTEFVIIIPMVVFIFALVLQTVFVAQVSQMMNYAAFTAARSYATSYSKEKMDSGGDANQGHQRAVRKAEFAANMAMAPVSGAVRGEGLSIWNTLRGSADKGLKMKATLYRVGEGMVVSAFYRMKNFSLPKPAESDTAVVNCTFEYMCPIDIPGIAELWNYLFYRDELETDNLGDVLIEQRFDDNRNNLVEGSLSSTEVGNLVSDAEAALDIIGGMLGMNNFSGGLSSFLGQPYASSDFLGAPINIRLFAKSAVGFEPWNGIPMMPRNDEVPFTDPDFQQCLDDMAALEQAIADQGLITTNVCNDAIAKSNAWEQAKTVYNQCVADNPDDFVTDCASELSDRNSKFNAFKAREQDCEDEGDKLGDRNDDLAEYECPAVPS